MPQRLLSILQSSLELWQPKLIAALLMGVVLDLVEALLRVVGVLFDVDPLLVVGVLLLLIGDLVTGVCAARRRGEARTSHGLRRTLDKLTTYVFSMAAITVVTNMMASVGEPWSTVGEWFMHAAWVYVALIELVSIVGNVTGSEEKAWAFLSAIWALARGKNPRKALSKAASLTKSISRKASDHKITKAETHDNIES